MTDGRVWFRALSGCTPQLLYLWPMGAFRPWIEYATGYGKDWERFLEGMDVKSDYHDEDSQTYFLKSSIVTSRSWDGSMLKSRGTKSNFSVH
jgi:hypothetical protein